MKTLIEEGTSGHSPESLGRRVPPGRGLVILRSGQGPQSAGRYSYVCARPFLRFRSSGYHAVIEADAHATVHFGDPWILMDQLMATYELLDEIDCPFPLGGCFGYWGYELRHFVEPGQPRMADDDLEIPDCMLGFYDSCVVFDHRLGKCWIIATGLQVDGSRNQDLARRRAAWWRSLLASEPGGDPGDRPPHDAISPPEIRSTLSPGDFMGAVRKAKSYIERGHIYQVNLSHRLEANLSCGPLRIFQRLQHASPAPYAAFLDFDGTALASASPELFLEITGPAVRTRPIKGTRPRSRDLTRDAQLSYELLTSPKELAELIMITDLLRNDLGRICEWGSVSVPDLIRLEKFTHVQHLVSTVEGRLRPGVSHVHALASCFPGGSITGAPKIRAMEIIDELEPVARGPYTGGIGYIGFNRASQINIAIRTAICHDGTLYFHAGAGIVADSDPRFEYEETLHKAAGFFAALREEKQEIPSSFR